MPANGSANFLELDTVADGVIDTKDDPYTPYYPGDDYVDWVGLSLYWYPDIGTGFNNLPEPTFLVDQIIAQGPSVQKFQPLVNGQANRNFYQNFAVARNKPMMLPETSSPYIPAVSTGLATELQIKQDWWRQIFSQEVLTKFPLLKLVLWFEEIKSDGAEIRDWRIGANKPTLDAFIKDMNAYHSQKTVAFSSNLKIACNGEVKITF